MSSQLDRWQGRFGVEYTDRNIVDWQSRVETFRRILHGRGIATVLEAGCNRGHNLRALESLGFDVAGVEPGEYARNIAREAGWPVKDGTVYEIPHLNASFGCVFTSGVLIHVPPDRLDEALRELHRVSRQWILAIEYPAVEDTVIDYRGHGDMLWKRDYGSHYRRLLHGLELISSGDLTAADGFNDAHYWLLEKTT